MSCLLLGHRGHRVRRFGEAENSLQAFARALGAGCDGIEFDLRRSGDGRIVVWHDAHLGRRAIAQTPLAELRRLHPGLATLDQVLARFGRRAWLDLEVKAPGLEAELVALLQGRPPRRGYVISSFQTRILHRLHGLDPALPLCLNLKRPRPLRRLPPEFAWIAPHQALCTGAYVRRLRAAGRHVLVWTVNSKRKMLRLAAAGADALCSDDPARLVAAVVDRPSRPAR